jgi:hypothetical protein
LARRAHLDPGERGADRSLNTVRRACWLREGAHLDPGAQKGLGRGLREAGDEDVEGGVSLTPPVCFVWRTTNEVYRGDLREAGDEDVEGGVGVDVRRELDRLELQVDLA